MSPMASPSCAASAKISTARPSSCVCFICHAAARRAHRSARGEQGEWPAHEARRAPPRYPSCDQIEAARVFGHSRWQILRRIISPQAAAFSVGPLIGLLVNQLQVTSLISVIGVADLTKIGNILNLRTLEPFVVWSVIGLTYYLCAKALAALGGRLERHLRRSVVWQGL